MVTMTLVIALNTPPSRWTFGMYSGIMINFRTCRNAWASVGMPVEPAEKYKSM